jgi:hypothetical protein
MDQEPRKTRKAGIIKITSGKILKKQINRSSEEFQLYNRFQIAREAGDIKEALRQIDILISYVEKAGKPSFEYQVDKMLMIDPGNFAQLIPIYEKQLDYYIEQDKIMGRIDALVSLSAVSLNSGQLHQAKHYINLAEGLFLSIPDENKGTGRLSSVTGISKVDVKLEQIRQVKRYIDATINTKR